METNLTDGEITAGRNGEDSRPLVLLRVALLAAATLHVGIYLAIALARLRYPFELEWMEGLSLDHVRRILDGRPLYVAPTPEFVPFVYTPLYFYVAAAAARIGGGGFVPLRLVSLLASLGSAGIIFAILRRETGSRLPAALGAGLFLATFRMSGAWFDVARVDSLFLFFVLLALALARFSRTTGGHAGAGLAFAVAFLAKQTALLIVLPVILHYLLFNRRRLAAFAAPLAAVLAGSTWILDRLHHGWYTYYVFHLPGRHDLEPRMILEFFTSDLRPLLVALAFSAYGLCSDLAAIDRRDRGRFYLLSGAGLVGGAWASRIHAGGYRNVLLPACAAAAILFGLGLHAALARARADRAPLRLVGAVYLLALLQFAVLASDPRGLVPRPEDAAAGRNLVEALGRIPGRVLVPSHGYLAVLAGKESCAHTMAVADVVRGDAGPGAAELTRRFSESIARRDFSAIVIDEKWFIAEELERAYVRAGPVFRGPGVFWPVTGMRTRPESIYLPRQ